MSLFQEGVARVAHAVLVGGTEKYVREVSERYAKRLNPRDVKLTAYEIRRRGTALATEQLLQQGESDEFGS